MLTSEQFTPASHLQRAQEEAQELRQQAADRRQKADVKRQLASPSPNSWTNRLTNLLKRRAGWNRRPENV
eukprot:5026697-Amphidinium_carterae.1